MRAIVNIFIDGENIVLGGLIVNPGQTIDLERSIKNDNMNEGNRFKFVEFTDKIENHRGKKLEDGIVRIEYQFEHPQVSDSGKEQLLWDNNIPWINNKTYPTDNYKLYPYLRSGCITTSGTSLQNNVGITVPGAKSTQQFTKSGSFVLNSQKYSIVLKLLGKIDDEKIIEPVLTKTNQRCTTCNHLNKITSKFCSECGTALKVY
jgi:hypothetical protein